MSAEPAENLNNATAEVDRFEAQRQAFSRLMARFTADRDAMIAAVQQCNERIDSLALRLAGGAVAVDGEASGDTGSVQGGSAAGLAEVRSLTERFLTQQQHALGEVRTASDRALQRADESLRRVREIVETGAQRDAGAEELRQAVDTFDDRLARLEEALIAVDGKETPAEDDEVARLLSERLAAVEEQLRGVDEAVESLRQTQRTLPSDDAGVAPMLNLGLRDLREQVAQLESLASWTPKLQRLWFSLVASAVVAVFAIIFVR